MTNKSSDNFLPHNNKNHITQYGHNKPEANSLRFQLNTVSELMKEDKSINQLIP